MQDPGHASLRKAARITVVMTAMVAFGLEVVHSSGFAIFAGFGAFALLGFANFGGPLRNRFLAGLGFTAVGLVLVLLGSAASGAVVVAAVAMFLVAFVVTLLGALGGYVAAGGTGVLLAFVLAVMIPLEPGQLDDRLVGWACAGIVGSIALVVLWPEQTRPKLRLGLADIARRLATSMREADEVDRVDAATVTETRAAVTALREEIDTSLSRPGGPRSRDQALLFLLDAMGRSSLFLARLAAIDRPGGLALARADRRALAASAAVLEEAAEVLVDGSRDPSAAAAMIAELDRVRGSEPASLLALVTATPTDGSPDATGSGSGSGSGDEPGAATGSGPGDEPGAATLERFAVIFPVRVLSHLARSIGTNAVVAVGRPPLEAAEGASSTSSTTSSSSTWFGATRRLGGGMRVQLRWGSRWFRNATRAAVALTAAVVVADVIRAEHAFWVVLGALSVLRSSVMETGSSALQSIGGTIAGFGVASVAMVVMGDRVALLWVLLPIAIMAAGYLPTVVSFAAGQAAFTLLVVVLFNLIAPLGWSVGLVRVESVAIGVSVSVVASLIFWPRGITHDLAAAAAAEYRALARYLERAIGAVLGSEPDALPDATFTVEHREAVAARASAESAFSELMNSRGSKTVDIDTWSRLVALPHALLVGGDWLHQAAVHERTPPPPTELRATVQQAGRQVVGAYDDVAARLAAASGPGANRPGVRPGVRRPAVDQAGITRPDTTRPDTTRPDAAAASRAEEATTIASGPDEVDRARAQVARDVSDGSVRADLTDEQVVGLVWTMEWLALLRDLSRELAGPVATVDEALERSWWR